MNNTSKTICVYPRKYPRLSASMSSISCILALITILTITLTLTTPAYAWLSGYDYRKEITVQADNIDATLTNFPVYIFIDGDEDIGGNMTDTTNYYDIRFTDSNDDPLAYECENMTISGDPSAATGHYWVQTTLDATDGATIYCYYGSSGAADGAGDPWDANYVGVWHCAEASWGGTPNEVKDTSGTGNNGVRVGDATTTATNAKIYRSGTFDGTGDNVDLGEGDDIIEGETEITVSAWVKLDIAADERRNYIVDNHGASLTLRRANTEVFSFAVHNGTAWGGATSATHADTNWHHVVGLWDASDVYIYVDGVSEDATPGSLSGGAINSTAQNLFISTDIADYIFDGLIDEVRISNTVRTNSAQWIKFEHANVNESDNELTWENEEVGNTAPILGHTANNVLGACTQDTDGTGNVNIPFRVQDADGNACTTTGWQYSQNGGGAWSDLTAAHLTSQDGDKTSATDWSGTEHTIVWASKNQIDDSDQADIQFRFKVNDGTVDSTSYGTSASFSVDNLDPTLSSIAWSDSDSSNTFSEDDTLTLTFSEAMKTSTVTADNVDTVLPPSSGNYGSSGAKGISWSNNTTLVVTLGASPTLARGATINPTTAVTDAAGNTDGTSGNGPAFVDPYGVVFDSITNNPIQGATVTIFTSTGTQCTPGDQIASTDTNPQTTSSTGEYSFLCANGSYYITVSASGYTYPSTKSSFPAGRTVTTGSKGETFTVAGSVLEIDQPLDPGSSILTITKDANKKDVQVGDIVTYTVPIENPTSSDITNVYLEDTIPAGFKYLEGKVTLDGQTIANPTGTRPLTFDIGTVSANTTKTLKYQLVVGSGVTLGNYENIAWAKYSDGTIVSNLASETVKVTPSALFDLGSIIGKVFWDLNENGRQDPLDVRGRMLDAKTKNSNIQSSPSNIYHLTSNRTEAGIPDVQIITADGTVITTDKHGKYHLPALEPGRHLLRLNEQTLPANSYLTTDKAIIVDITPGLIAKVNFGVNIEGKQHPLDVRGRMLEAKEKTETQPDTSNIQHLTSNESRLFFVAMGDAKAGYTFHQGYIQPIQHDDKYREGFWYEGKLAYYLKGKVLGKYLITSSLDTNRSQKELFKHIDPDKFYPVYGDASKIDYEASSTQGALYLLVEWDKSHALWGNYLTDLNTTELASFNRTLYGGKLSYQSVSTTRFGQPKTKLILFRSQAKQKASHNEFLSTGGSLYYLKHKDITQGSEKVTLEVRDKLTHLVLSTKTLSSSQDYEIDYTQGRLTLYQPVPLTVDSNSIISSTLTLGHPLYLVIDYEYQTKDKYDQGISGLRAQKALSDYLTIGTTYINEDQEGQNYTLKAADTQLNLGQNTTLTCEYAQSSSEQLDYYISTDGGLSFTALNTSDDFDQGEALSLKVQTHLFDQKLNLTSYYKIIEKGFSLSKTISQQGKKLKGASLKLNLSPNTQLTARHDIQKLLSDGNPQSSLQVGATQTKTTQAQLTHTKDKLTLTGEYRHQELNDKLNQYQSETNSETDTLALQADYQLKDNLTLSLTQQANLTGPQEHKTTAGISSQLNPNLTLRGKQTLSTEGNATSIGATFTPAKESLLDVRRRMSDEKEQTSNITHSTLHNPFSPSAIALSADLTHTNYQAEGSSDTISLSAQGRLDEQTLFHTTYALTDSQKQAKTESITFGSTKRLTPEYSLTTDKTYAKTKDKLTQAHSFSLRRETLNNQTLEASLTEQHSSNQEELSSSNIFSLTGDITDNFKIQGSFEKGTVQKHNGNLYNRHATSFTMGYAKQDPKTKETHLTASSKLEFRFDEGAEEINHLLITATLEERPNPNTHLFAKANISQTKETTNNYCQAKYKELVLGAAYRPLFLDKLNVLAKYTYLEDDSPSTQTDISDIEAEKSHTVSTELIYDITPQYQLVEKLAFKEAKEDTLGFDFTKTQTYLNITRLNYSPHSNWQLALEYRRLTQEQAEDTKQGALIEISRNLGQFIQLGTGYNFTDFSDDLTHLDYTSHGPFIRLTGKLYDRTPEEIEQAKQAALERKLEVLLTKRLKQSPQKEEILTLYNQAEHLYTQGQLKEAQAKYQTLLTTINQIELEERIKLEQLLKQEQEINSLYHQANELYKNGLINEAQEYYNKCLKQIETLTTF